MEFITVYYGSRDIWLSLDYAALKGIHEGSAIKSDAEFWNILSEHSQHQIEKLKLLIAAKNHVN